jgi:hypothetical protein
VRADAGGAHGRGDGPFVLGFVPAVVLVGRHREGKCGRDGAM